MKKCLLALMILLSSNPSTATQVQRILTSLDGEIWGRVIDEHGNPIVGAEIFAVPLPMGGASGLWRTDQEGNFRMIVASGGNYQITASKELAYYLEPSTTPFGFRTGPHRNPVVDLTEKKSKRDVIVRFNPALGGIKPITYDNLDSRILRSKIQVFKGEFDPKKEYAKEYAYTFTEQNYCKPLLLPEGHYNVRLTHEGYEPVQFSTEIVPRKSSLFMIPLVKSKGNAYQR